jgi:hypothetical protein
MKSPEEIVAFIAKQIGLIYYHRPLMYGGTAEGVDLLLHTYHRIWAEMVERQDKFQHTYWDVLAEADCGSANFSTRFAMDHQKAPEDEVVAFVTKQRRIVSDRLEIPIPHDRLRREFDEFNARIQSHVS